MFAVHFVLHESFEAPGAIELWATSRNCRTSYTRLYSGDRFPDKCDFDFLVIMGGPQCPTTTKEECPHFDSPSEIAFIQKAIAEKKIVLGVCLGAQFIGEALGAGFEHSPNREIGNFPIELTEAGARDALLAGFPAKFAVAHWHGDMPGLTPDAEVLAKSEGCPRQIVRYAPAVYGFQCHFEFTSDSVESMIEHCSHELREHRNLPYVQSERELRAFDYRPMNELLFQFLDRLTSVRAIDDTAKAIVGSWALVSCEAESEQGEVERVYGENPFGRLMYGPDGRMSVLIAQSKLEPGAGLICATPDTFSGFLAYCGTYRLVPETHKVVHSVEACNILSWIGSEQERFFELNGKILAIATAPYERNGQQWISTLAWKRLPPSTRSRFD